MLNIEIKRGDIVYVKNNITPIHTGIQHGNRPYLVVSNNAFNKRAPCVNAIPLTTKKCKPTPAHVLVHRKYGIKQTSIVLCEQIITISKEQIVEKICSMPEDIMLKIDSCLSFQLGL